MEGNVLYSGQWKSAQTERELSVETKTVWVLESSPEGICNHLSSLTVSFFKIKKIILLITASCVFVYCLHNDHV